MKPGQMTLSPTSMVRPASTPSSPERTMVTVSPLMPTTAPIPGLAGAVYDASIAQEQVEHTTSQCCGKAVPHS